MDGIGRAVIRIVECDREGVAGVRSAARVEIRPRIEAGRADMRRGRPILPLRKRTEVGRAANP